MDRTDRLRRTLAVPWQGVLRLVGGGPPGERAVGSVAGVTGVAAVSVVIALGRGPALAASMAAFPIFDFFFVDPVHTFTVAEDV
jgi:hypothetical protein